MVDVEGKEVALAKHAETGWFVYVMCEKRRAVNHEKKVKDICFPVKMWLCCWSESLSIPAIVLALLPSSVSTELKIYTPKDLT